MYRNTSEFYPAVDVRLLKARPKHVAQNRQDFNLPQSLIVHAFVVRVIDRPCHLDSERLEMQLVTAYHRPKKALACPPHHTRNPFNKSRLVRLLRCPITPVLDRWPPKLPGTATAKSYYLESPKF
jgi:hypothetical protein